MAAQTHNGSAQGRLALRRALCDYDSGVNVAGGTISNEASRHDVRVEPEHAERQAPTN
jgi:hypothetical protein